MASMNKNFTLYVKFNVQLDKKFNQRVHVGKFGLQNFTLYVKFNV